MTEKLGLVDANIAIVDDTIVIQFYNTSQIESLNEINGTTVCVDVKNGSVTYSSESGKITKCLKGLSKQINKKIPKITNVISKVNKIGVSQEIKYKKLLDSIISILHEDLSKFQNCVINKFNLDYMYVKNVLKRDRDDVFYEYYDSIINMYKQIADYYISVYSNIMNEKLLSIFDKYIVKELESRKTIGIFSFDKVFLFTNNCPNLHDLPNDYYLIDVKEFLEGHYNNNKYRRYISKIIEKIEDLRPDYVYFITKDGPISVFSVIASALSRYTWNLKTEHGINLSDIYTEETNLSNFYELFTFPFMIEIGKLLGLYYINEKGIDFGNAYGCFYTYGDDNNLESCVTSDPYSVEDYYRLCRDYTIFTINIHKKTIENYVNIFNMYSDKPTYKDCYYMITYEDYNEYITIGRRLRTDVELISISNKDIPNEYIPIILNMEFFNFFEKPYGTSITRAYLNLYSIINAVRNSVSVANFGTGIYVIIGTNNNVFKFTSLNTEKTVFGYDLSYAIEECSYDIGDENGYEEYVLPIPYQDSFIYIDQYSKYLLTGNPFGDALSLPCDTFGDIYSIRCPYCGSFIVFTSWWNVDGYVESCPFCAKYGYVCSVNCDEKLNVYENNLVLEVHWSKCKLLPSTEIDDYVYMKGIYVEEDISKLMIDPALVYSIGMTLSKFYSEGIIYGSNLKSNIFNEIIKSKFDYVDICYENVQSIGLSHATLSLTYNLDCKIRYTNGTEMTVKVKDLISEILNLLYNKYPELKQYSEMLYFMMLIYLCMFIYGIYDASIVSGSEYLSNEYLFNNLNISGYIIPIRIGNEYYDLFVDKDEYNLKEHSGSISTKIIFSDGDVDIEYLVNLKDVKLIFDYIYTYTEQSPLGVITPMVHIDK